MVSGYRKNQVYRTFPVTHDRGKLFVLLVIMAFIVLAGCTVKEKISEDQAVQAALNDPAVLSHIGNQSYAISDVSVAQYATGSESPVEVYSVTIDLLNGTHQRYVAFVSYDGTVVSVITAYPPPKPSAGLINASVNRSSIREQ